MQPPLTYLLTYLYDAYGYVIYSLWSALGKTMVMPLLRDNLHWLYAYAYGSGSYSSCV